MRRHLRLVRPGDEVRKQKPDYNIRTLQRKAASALHHIASSGLETFRYPKIWVRYLRLIAEKLQNEENPPPVHELVELEQDLEAIEAGMIHMHITTRPCEVLFLPRALPPEIVDRLAYLRQKLQPPSPPIDDLPLSHQERLLRLRRRQL